MNKLVPEFINILIQEIDMEKSLGILVCFHSAGNSNFPYWLLCSDDAVHYCQHPPVLVTTPFTTANNTLHHWELGTTPSSTGNSLWYMLV